MHKNLKPYITITVLSFTIIYCFAFPKEKYTSPDILSQMKIPYEINNWQGIDTEQEWNSEDKKYDFISQTFERHYVNMNGKSLFLLILNGSNFHNPKVCYNSAGFKVKELNDPQFRILNHTFKTHALYAKNNEEGYLLIYWICINKNIVDWTEQKIKQLWFSLLNKNRASLMIRLDIPSKEDNIDDALRLAKEFIADLGQALTQKDLDYIFGSRK